jgi:hypothetical protein
MARASGPERGDGVTAHRMSARGPVTAALLLAVAAPVLLVVLAGCAGSTPGDAGNGDPAPGEGDAALASAFEDQAHDLQVQGSGTVVKVLPDDIEGGRHQRFVIRLESGQTLLVAHNIDVAPRVEGLSAGDTVAFNGIYEWNPEGGTIHWTHKDPNGNHAPGWLRLDGRTYQ